MPAHVRTRLIEAFAAGDRVGSELRRCWLDVSNAGGAVGFPFPPVAEEQMDEAMLQLVDDVASGVLLIFLAERDDEVLGWVGLRLNRSALTEHWASVERLQTRPEHRNQGVARILMSAVALHAATMGLEQLRLVLRGGEELEGFYHRLGWSEVGRHCRALRLADGDDRDEVVMVLPVESGPPIRGI